MTRPRIATHEDYRRTRYFGALDGLRCLSIVWVVGYHDKLTNTALFRRGDYGVGLFFVISGFLITTLLIRRKGRPRRDFADEFLRPPNAPDLPALLRGCPALYRTRGRDGTRSGER